MGSKTLDATGPTSGGHARSLPSLAYYPEAIRDHHEAECGIPLNAVIENLTMPLWDERWGSDGDEDSPEWIAAEHRALRLCAEMLRDIAASPMNIGAYAAAVESHLREKALDVAA